MGLLLGLVWRADAARSGTNCGIPRRQESVCAFDSKKLAFRGGPVEQARCLLRPVLPGGRLGVTSAPLPPPLAGLVGERVALGAPALRRFLAERSIRESQLGGSLDRPLSRARNGARDAPLARYFVIHDTSTPEYPRGRAFPPELDRPGWLYHDLTRWTRGKPRAHVFISRLGTSVTAVPFDRPWRATKFELRTQGLPSKGLFLHVELVQPRREDACGRASEAPVPGFTDAQLDRLALVYVAASLRRGQWLVPAFHAVLDVGFAEGHDDPQHFELSDWADRLRLLLDSLGAPEGAGPGSASGAP